MFYGKHAARASLSGYHGVSLSLAPLTKRLEGVVKISRLRLAEQNVQRIVEVLQCPIFKVFALFMVVVCDILILAAKPKAQFVSASSVVDADH